MSPQETFEAAAAALKQGESLRAGALYRELLAVHPEHPGVLHGLAIVQARMGDAVAAISLLERAVRAAPEHPALLFDLARLLAARGEDERAAELFERLIKVAPAVGGAWGLLAQCRGRLGRHAAANEAYRRALELQPDDVVAIDGLARGLRMLGDYEGALAVFARAEAAGVRSVGFFFGWARFCAESLLLERAHEVLLRGLEAHPEDPDLLSELGQAQEGLGDAEGAKGAYERLLSLVPDHAQALSGLIALPSGDGRDAARAQAESLLLRNDLPDRDRALLQYALGKWHDKQGAYERAFASWNDANAARRRVSPPPDLADAERQVGVLCGRMGRDFFVQRHAVGHESAAPIFIVGMPRSGTTLVEQILGAHREVAALGELPDLPYAAQSIRAHGGQLRAWPECLFDAPDAVLRAAADQYLAAVAWRLASPGQRFTDKAPFNFFNLGLIHTLFPNARIVWCRRDPLDVGLSIYAENFSLSQAFSTDLGDIAMYLRHHERVMAHWQQVMPQAIVELRYESLVHDFEPQVRQLLAQLSLPWDDACLHFNTRGGTVWTPSRWQVRQPISTVSVGRWRRYATQLAPLRADFERVES